ncbi:unnamed protein product [Bursaphelenchus xylophilus]|uniref:(pine wood nematode) hypothetical protein n=1 Tax=Bursaphelenchus xylophilus TaxID=6326 RepID=A0A1I7S1J1_BURXY|nr:unnamed protein product [Bursaphelenchus xylophilus]CAG9081423.1 unnamed protein product [Bursaphelenchus xylophilus]
MVSSNIKTLCDEIKGIWGKMKSGTLLILVLVGLCALSVSAQGYQPGGFMDKMIDKFRIWRDRFVNWLDPRRANQQYGGYDPSQMQAPMPIQPPMQQQFQGGSMQNIPQYG